MPRDIPDNGLAAALAALHEAGAHFVRCNEEKAATRTDWQRRKMTLDAARRHAAGGGLLGVIPASLGCVVMDFDHGDDAARDAVLRTLGNPVAVIASQKPGRFHLWYRHADAAHVGNGKWYHGGAERGELRGGNGYAILWDAPALAAALADRNAARALLGNADMAQLQPDAGAAAPHDGDLWEVGRRNDTLNKLAFAAARNGDEAGVEAAAQAAREAGLPEREIAATVESADKGAAKAGKRQLVAQPFDPAGFEAALAIVGTALRINTRARRFEFQRREEWNEGDDHVRAAIRATIARRCSYMRSDGKPYPLIYSKERFHDLMDALGHYRRVDPFIEWLEGLPAWDGCPRIDALLEEMFGAAPEPLTRWASAYLGLGAVQRAYEPGCKLDEVPILLGEQGCGKSAFTACWFPPEWAGAWHGDAIDLAARPKEQAEGMAGKVVCELSELAGLRKAELERLKSFITRQDDGQFRWAYARAPVSSPRRVVLVGTTNEPECLPNDPSGNRRFVVVELPHGCDVEAAARDRAQWWAEALHRYREGQRANLPRSLILAQRERAEEHRGRDALEDRVAAALAQWEGHTVTISALLTHPALEGLRSDMATQHRVGAAIRQAGWQRSEEKVNGRKRKCFRRGPCAPAPQDAAREMQARLGQS